MKRSWLVLLGIAFAACGEGQGGGPLPVLIDDDTAPPGDPADPAPQTKRTIIVRNPFGNVAASGNLLWDGDFEFRPSFPEQYGWLAGSGVSVGFDLPGLGMGKRCKSGIKCAELAPGQLILGMSVGSAGNDLHVAFWAYADSGECSAVRASFTPQTPGIVGESIEPPPGPGDDGWCRFEIVSPARETAAYLVIENVSSAPVVVDDATVLVTSGAQTRVASSRHVSGAEAERLDRIKASARRARQPRREPPSRGHEVLQARFRRLQR